MSFGAPGGRGPRGAPGGRGARFIEPPEPPVATPLAASSYNTVVSVH